MCFCRRAVRIAYCVKLFSCLRFRFIWSLIILVVVLQVVPSAPAVGETDYSDPFDARPDPRPRPGWEQNAIEACSSYMEPFEAQRFISGTAVPHWISYNTKESIYSAAVIPVVSFVVWTVLCGNLVYVNWSLTTRVLIHFHNTHT